MQSQLIEEEGSECGEDDPLDTLEPIGLRANRDSRPKVGKRDGAEGNESRHRPRYMSKVGMNDGSRRRQYGGHSERTGKRFLYRLLEEPGVSRRKQKSSGICQESRYDSDPGGDEHKPKPPIGRTIFRRRNER